MVVAPNADVGSGIRVVRIGPIRIAAICMPAAMSVAQLVTHGGRAAFHSVALGETERWGFRLSKIGSILD